MKPRTSLNMIVMMRSSPPSTSFSGDLRELLDQSGRQILAERRADALPIRLLADVIDEHESGIDREARHQRKRQIDQHVLLLEQHPETPRPRRRHRRPGPAAAAAPIIGANTTIATPITKAARQFHQFGIKRITQERAGQRRLEDLGVDLDARHGTIDWRRLDIQQSDRRCSDQDNLAFDAFAAQRFPRARPLPKRRCPARAG